MPEVDLLLHLWLLGPLVQGMVLEAVHILRISLVWPLTMLEICTSLNALTATEDEAVVGVQVLQIRLEFELFHLVPLCLPFQEVFVGTLRVLQPSLTHRRALLWIQLGMFRFWK